MASTMAVDTKPEKKHKKDKSSKSDKKRARDEDAPVDGERKHKKSKSASSFPPPDSITETVLEADIHNGDAKSEKKKKKKDKKREDEESGLQDGDVAQLKADKKMRKKLKKESSQLDEIDPPKPIVDGESPKKKKKKDVTSADDADRSEHKKKKSSKKHSEDSAEVQQSQLEEEAEEREATPAPIAEDAMDIDVDTPARSSKPPKIHQPPDIPADPQFPFFTQTVSLYEPLYPMGWAQPVTSSQSQHLRHLQNRYVPSLRGVLMDYKNVALGEFPGRQGAATDDDMPTTLLSKNEAAVGFGWITADVDLFVPSRGAWMEGSINLQTEGHIGVVCFGKFNASIEARRLPPSWKWIPNEAPEAQGFEETASVITADDHGVVRQIHSTGFWADAKGNKVKGKIRFRIRNFDVGTSGETSYLSLEGTMLDKQGEKKLIEEEARVAKLRKDKKSGQNRERRRVPEFSMTRFDVEESGEQGQTAQSGTEEPENPRLSRFDSEE